MRYGRPIDASVQAQITVSLDCTDSEVVLSVSDNGPGLSPHQHSQVMGRGAQGEDGRSLGLGVGLGMSIVQQYVGLLEGRIELETTSGLSVRIRLRKAPRP